MSFLGFLFQIRGSYCTFGVVCAGISSVGVVFLPPNPLEEVFGRPFVSRIVVRMTLPCAPMDMKIGVGEGHFRWR